MCLATVLITSHLSIVYSNRRSLHYAFPRPVNSNINPSTGTIEHQHRPIAIPSVREEVELQLQLQQDELVEDVTLLVLPILCAAAHP